MRWLCHHASFHSLENPAENAVLKKWSDQEASIKDTQAAAGASKKRKSITQAVASDRRIVQVESEYDMPQGRQTKRRGIFSGS